MPDADIPILERPAFFDGQRLTAADLEAVAAFQREQRWLHNRTLHDWGIAQGLAVTGAKGGRTVRVQPGVALDCRGRELVLDEPAEPQVPAVAGTAGAPAIRYLTACYVEDADAEPVARRGPCGESGAVRRAERARLRFQDPADQEPASRYRPGLDVILAAVAVRDCVLAGPPSPAERQDAVTVLRPYVAAGATRRGGTTWRLWPDAAAPVGVATTVSTSEGGFRAVPRYQARVGGDRLAGGFAVDGYPEVANATAGGFELRVLLPRGTTLASDVYTVTPADLATVVTAALQRIVDDLPFGVSLPDDAASAVLALGGLNHQGAVLRAGDRLDLPVAGPLEFIFELLGVDFSAQVLAADFQPALDDIATRAGVSVPALRSANDLNPPQLTVGGRLALPGTVLPLNPPAEVLSETFVRRLGDELGWHVVWMGVEA